MDRPVGTIYGDYTDFLLFASDIVLVATLVFWMASKYIMKEPFKKGPIVIILPVVALTLISAVSTIPSIDAPLSIYHGIRLMLLTGLIFFIIDQVKGAEELVTPVALQIVIQSIVGISQFLRQSDIGLQVLGEYPLKPEWDGVSVVTIGDMRWLRAYGLSDHPNILGGCLAFGLLLLLGSALTGYEQKRPLTMGAFAIGMVCLFVTFSRASWLAFGSGAAVMLLMSIKNWDALLRGGLYAAIAAIAVIPFAIGYANLIQVRMPFSQQSIETPSERQSLGERDELNAASIVVFEKYPILGAGIGTLPEAIWQEFPDFPNNYQPAHLTLIDAAAETGLIGATVYFILLAAPWVVLAINKKVRREFRFIMVFAPLAATVVVSFLDYYTWLLAPGRLWQYVIWGVWAVGYQAAGWENDNV